MIETRLTLLGLLRDLANASAWAEFHALYQPLLIAYGRSRGLSDDDAQEVAQEVFTRLVKALPKFALQRERARFRTWLFQVWYCAKVDLVDRRRRRQVRAERAWFERLGESSPRIPEDPDWLTMYHRRVLAFALEQIRERVERVRPTTWACFERHLLQSRPSAEVAAELGLTVNAVNLNSSRVLARVRDFCAGYLEGLTDDLDPLPDRP
jgi:RNA polymerase sigma-70 factor (ECF subfamily)